MNTKKPIVSVVLAVYNGERYLSEAIDSVLAQSFKHFELIIVDDASTDKTSTIIQAYHDHRIQYIKLEDNGRIANALNSGLMIAKGEFIARMDSDDICKPDRLEVQVQYLRENPSCDICGSYIEEFNEYGKRNIVRVPIHNNSIRAGLLWENCIVHPSVMYRRGAFLVPNMYRTDMIPAEDYDLWVRLMDDVCFANIPKVLLNYRTHSESATKTGHNLRQEKVKEVFENVFQKLEIPYDNEQLELHHQFYEKEIFLHGKFKEYTSWMLFLVDFGKHSEKIDFKSLKQITTEKWFEQLAFASMSIFEKINWIISCRHIFILNVFNTSIRKSIVQLFQLHCKLKLSSYRSRIKMNTN